MDHLIPRPWCNLRTQGNNKSAGMNNARSSNKNNPGPIYLHDFSQSAILHAIRCNAFIGINLFFKVHYYEDGNVQLVSSKEISSEIKVTVSIFLPSNFIKNYFLHNNPFCC